MCAIFTMYGNRQKIKVSKETSSNCRLLAKKNPFTVAGFPGLSLTLLIVVYQAAYLVMARSAVFFCTKAIRTRER